MTEQKDEFDKMEKCLKAVKTWNDYKGDLSMELFTEILDSRLEFYKISEPANKLIVLKNTVVGSECGKILKLKPLKTICLWITKLRKSFSSNAWTEKVRSRGISC